MIPDVWPAPAKINLLLHVVGRRADGYHALQTVFQFLDLQDELTVRARDDGKIIRITPLEGVPEESDLTLRAARLLRECTGVSHGAEIGVRKRIPAGGGLGGGSSDAATTLVALNRLWGVDLNRPSLASLGLELGADVPVFVHGQAAWAEGVGERIEPLELEEPWYLLVCPPVEVSTAAVFSDAALTRHTPLTTIADLLADGRTGDERLPRVHALLARGRNDCEPVARALHPEVDEALEWLSQCGPARLTGTGGCMFVPFAQREEAVRWLAKLPQPLRGFVTRGINRSPLLSL